MTVDVAAAPMIDLYSPSSFSNGHPYDQYAWLRENDPVHSHPAPLGGTFWAVTRYEDIRHVERSPELFTTSPTVLIDAVLALPQFLASDGAPHRQLRGLVWPALMPKAVRMRMPALRDIARSVVDGVCDRGSCDLVTDVAGPMAGIVAAELLGIPPAWGPRLHELLMVLHSSVEVTGEQALTAAITELMVLGKATFDEKRARPAEDVLTSFAHAELDGREITEIEFIGNFISLVDGGLDTSRNLIAGGMRLLFEHPDQRAIVDADVDGRLPMAIEEMLRYLSPVTYIRRVAKQDLQIAGQPVAAGDRVVVYFGAGNRDASVFEDPDRFDVLRDPNPHIAFGAGGPHFCVGAHLGRANGIAMITELLTRLPDIEQAGPAQWATTSLTSGLARMPVSFSPA